MRLLCKMGLHGWVPIKAFGAYIVYWYGERCFHCQQRRIKRGETHLTDASSSQAAYDWLNERPQQGAVLKLVKKR